jgi:hypothetical protein
MQQTPEFYQFSGEKMVIDKTSSLLRHDSSAQLPLLDCMCIHPMTHSEFRLLTIILVELDLN